ncbi:ribonuclease J [Alteromonas sediminis]|uniref:Ribonuclease J n=2 Tax=Alteromonas sediminis TaxID=2259342 RepID=A0A3N5Z9F0_9ALTE|nr:ribonuclease J [Alteromonas sediminis]
MNMNLYGHNGSWLVVDCGVSFDEPLIPSYKNSQENEEEGPTHRVVCADPQFIIEQKEAVAGIVITHAHEDHIGAIADIWPYVKAPIYATPFTVQVAQRKLAERQLLHKVELITVPINGRLQIGHFDVSWLAMTHSIPEPSALVIRTPVGTVLHTADWKIDAAPIVGKPFDNTALLALKHEANLTVVGDSTNATKPGYSLSEQDCYEGLLATVRGQAGRVVVGCFASNIARLISLAKIASETGRYLCLLGRSLHNMYSNAKATGYWPEDAQIIDHRHAGYLLPEEVLALATGTQGEPRAALARLASESHQDLELDKGDTVIFSSIVIPGNEKSVEKLVRQLKAKEVKVLMSEHYPLAIHASGHPNKEELTQLYHWTRPERVIPTHGELQHLRAHAEIAKNAGVKKTSVGINGDLFELAPQSGVKRQKVTVGRWAINR